MKQAMQYPHYVTHVDDECQRLSRVVFNQLLLVGSEKLRVLHVLQQEVTFMRVPVLVVCLAVKGGGAVTRVGDVVQEELHRGLLGLAGYVGWAGDHGDGDHFAALKRTTADFKSFPSTDHVIDDTICLHYLNHTATLCIFL